LLTWTYYETVNFVQTWIHPHLPIIGLWLLLIGLIIGWLSLVESNNKFYDELRKKAEAKVTA